jgi:1,4-alpha-glucan branching enzyme
MNNEKVNNRTQMPIQKKKISAPKVHPPRDGFDGLLSCCHPDPHSQLGVHPEKDGLRIRVYRPEAEAVWVYWPSGTKKPMTAKKLHPAGFFEVLVEGAKEATPYQVKVEYPNGNSFTYWDPYAFWPTLGDMDLYLVGEGSHQRLYEKMGAHVMAHQGVEGVAFAVWAPGAAGVSVVGDFNGWDGRLHQMRCMGASGIWEIFLPELRSGAKYKYEIRTKGGGRLLKADPYAFAMEKPPLTASVVHQPRYQFKDQEWMKKRGSKDPLRQPLSIYEVHLESWRKVPEEDNRPLTYREMAVVLTDYVKEMGFTHVEFMPVMEHPFGGSWGYQVSAYYAPTSRFGSPDDFRFLVDTLHQHGIGVILDWVPAHFPKDEFALGRFDGTALYEHLDPRQGEHPDWGTYVFNFGRNEVRNFLLSNALFWLSEYHVDGLRLDAVASMLYLDYSRKEGEWVPNQFGGNENLDAISFLKKLNELVYAHHPGVLMIAEESTAWAGVSRPTYTGGLGFGFKWNMGWMHDTLFYFSRDPIYRRYDHNNLTFGFLYAWSENFILPISHDEVVHGKCSLIDKMPGDRWQKFAGLRSLFGYMWAHPGKKLLFMGCEFAQFNEWNNDQSLDWHLTEWAPHYRMQDLIRDLNRLYLGHPALWEADVEPAGFQWIDANNADDNAVAYLRKSRDGSDQLLVVGNFSPVIRNGYRVGVPKPGFYPEVLNTDSYFYGGSNFGNNGGVHSEEIPAHGQPHSVVVSLPPLSTLWFEIPA